MSLKTSAWIALRQSWGGRMFVASLLFLVLLMPRTARAESETEAVNSSYKGMPAWKLEAALQERPLSEPITVMIIGGIPVVVGVAAILLGTFASAACSVSDSFESEVDDEEATFSNCAGDPERRPFFVVGGISAGAGALILGAGGLWLGLRLKERREIQHALEAQKSSYLTDKYLGVGPTMERGAPGLALRLTF